MPKANELLEEIDKVYKSNVPKVTLKVHTSVGPNSSVEEITGLLFIWPKAKVRFVARYETTYGWIGYELNTGARFLRADLKESAKFGEVVNMMINMLDSGWSVEQFKKKIAEYPIINPKLAWASLEMIIRGHV